MATSSIPQKRCTKCDKEFPATTEYFYRNACRLDGLFHWCKLCEGKRIRQWRTDNPEKVREQARRHRIAHPDKYKANQQRNRTRNSDNWRERRLDHQREYRATNVEKIRDRSRQWARDNPDKIAAKVRNYQARKRAADGKHTAADVKAQLERQKSRCYYCDCKLGKSYHVDHVIPISRGGSNDPSNLVIACQHCNDSKNNKLPHEWPEGGRLL